MPDSSVLPIDLFSQDNLCCPQQAHQALLAAGRMVEIHGASGSVELAVPHHEDVKALLRSEHLSTSLFEGDPELIDYIAGTDMESFMENHFFGANPEKHRRLRQATSAGFSPRVMEPFRGELRAEIEKLLAPLQKRQQFDLAAEVSIVLPTRIMQRLFHFSEEVMPLFVQLGAAMHQIHSPGALDEKKYAVDEFNRILPMMHSLMDQRRESPVAHDFLSVMLQEEIDTPRGKMRLSRDEASAAAIVLLFSAVNTSIDVLSFAVIDLLASPEQRALALHDEQSLEDAVLEVIRREFPFPAYHQLLSTATTPGFSG